MCPDDLKYHREHMWVRVSGKKAVIGITHYGQMSLGNVLYIDLPDVETDVEANAEFAEIESARTSMVVTSPVSGTVIEVNEELAETPEMINDDPYGEGWIAVIKLKNSAELNRLMEAFEYERYLEKEVKLI
ncbi:MAG: glycine cleavage system protein GcvH [Nitrospirae bacterium]|nr:glycine cleavage system protein GcvH [Nitrospirota bacterium]